MKNNEGFLEKYERLDMEIIEFECEDIIVTSSRSLSAIQTMGTIQNIFIYTSGN